MQTDILIITNIITILIYITIISLYFIYTPNFSIWTIIHIFIHLSLLYISLLNYNNFWLVFILLLIVMLSYMNSTIRRIYKKNDKVLDLSKIRTK